MHLSTPCPRSGRSAHAVARSRPDARETPCACGTYNPGTSYFTPVRRSDTSHSRRPGARLAAGMTLTAFDTVLRHWSDSVGAEDPTALTDRAFALLAPALDNSRPPG